MLIGIAGRARAGKDTAADFTCKRFRFFNKHSFAKPIKEACRAIFDWNDRHLYGDLKETIDPFYGISPRYAMQTLGTEWGRDIINPSIWVLRAAKEYRNNIEAVESMVVPDVRFENECQWVFDEGGIVIQLERDSNESIAPDHISEAGISHMLRPNKDFILDNNGPVIHLHKELANIVRTLIGDK